MIYVNIIHSIWINSSSSEWTKYVVIDLTPSGILGIFLGLPTRRFLLFTTVFLLPSLRLARAGFFLQALGASFFYHTSDST